MIEELRKVVWRKEILMVFSMELKLVSNFESLVHSSADMVMGENLVPSIIST